MKLSKLIGCSGLFIIGTAMICAPIAADTITVRHREGASHGFVELRSEQGKILAAGDAVQTIDGAHVTSVLVLHFLDGSLYEETTVFEQRSVFRLLSDHLTEQGPSFPNATDVLIDSAGKVTIRGAKDQNKTYQLSIPNDAANGLLFAVIKNLPTLEADTSVSLVTTASKPRVVKFRIRPTGTQAFTAGGPERKAVHLVGHTEIPGVAGAMAHVMGKQPPDVDFWVSEGKVPTFVKFRGPLYDQGPIWSIELTSPRLEERTAELPIHH